jgi:cytochrome oxidase Cu insertion factor (SCO1/SenC/PrrC family)
MSGMSHPLQLNNPLIMAAFHSALLHQLLVILGVGAVLAVGWNVLFALELRRRAATEAAEGASGELGSAGTGTPAVKPAATGAGPGAARAGTVAGPEPLGRRFLRITFGLLWVLDGLLQLQNGMPLGMPDGVVKPAATGSPAWVHSIVNAGTTIWSNHPVEAAASVVWIQLGIGLVVLLSPRGRWSRLAGLASVGWAVVVWIFGEAFGGVFGHGLSWLTGAPGAVLFYGAAGVLLALPETAWRGRTLGRVVTSVMGLFFLGMALLQAWPGRSSWQGGTGPKAGNLVAMVRTMAGTPQPHALSSWVAAFAGFDGAHGWAVNLFVVVALAAIGAALLSGRRRAVVAATAAAAVLCLATWVLVQDFGFFGGVGTDPNSMLPQLFFLGGGVLGMLRAPAEAPEPAFLSVRQVAAARGARRWDLVTPGVAARAAAALVAVVVVGVGVIPMAAASTNPNASPIVTEAENGSVDLVNSPAPGFTLTDQNGKTVSLASLRGKAVALTFLDPVCTTDCPIIAQTFHQADERLGAASDRTVFVAIVANPVYHSVPEVDAFDREEHLTGVKNWLYLTGSVQALTKVWNEYGIQVTTLPAGTMVAHSELAYVIDGQGQMRAAFGADPGTTSAGPSSLATLVDQELQRVIGQ